jgi:hypothetical protein
MRARSLLALLALSLALSGVAAASQPAPSYSIDWSKIAGGGAQNLTGGTFSLSGTAGQWDTGATMTGGTLSLTGGFWYGSALTLLADAPPGANAQHKLSLAGFRSNPVLSSRLQLSFSLASDAPARIELIDVSGRRVNAYDVGLLGAGSHSLDLGGGVRVMPGLYWVRLTQAGQSLTQRAVVIE